MKNDSMKNIELDNWLNHFFGSKKELFLNAAPEPTAVRVNTLRSSAAEFQTRLKQLNVRFKALPFNPDGFIIPEDVLPLSHTLDFFCGKIQYQGVASQLPVLALNPKPGERVLDIAAAPGSKSTQIAALMQNKGSLYLNDFSRKRMQALNSNTQKAGVVNQVLLNFNGERLGNLFPAYFDKILLDAPCTALGTLNSQPEVGGWWSLEKLAKLASIQERLLISAMKALKPGGEMVYSTCSIAPEENEILIQSIIDKYPLEIIPFKLPGAENFARGLQSYNGLTFTEEMKYALRVFPGEHEMEGFFVIRLRKTEAYPHHQPWKKAAFVPTKDAYDEAVASDLEEISDLYGIPKGIWENYRYIRTQKRIWMSNKENTEIPAEGVSSAGLLLGEKKQFMWKLFNQSARFFEGHISKRRLSLTKKQMIELFAQGKMELAATKNGYYALEWNGRVVGSIYVESGRVKLRLPHRFRLILQEDNNAD